MKSALVLGWLCVAGAAAGGEAPLSPTELQRAVQLDKQKCWRCHKPHDPRPYSNAEWNDWMTKMSRKARLKAADEQLLRRHFDQVRRTPPPNPS